MRYVLVLLFLVASCGRPLTPNETAYLAALKGDSVEPRRVRLVDGHLADAFAYRRPVRPRVTCQERIWPPLEGDTVTVSPGAVVLFNTVFVREDLYAPDMMAGWPDEIDLFAAMLVAHEFTHVWQWQNRARTRYHPLRGAAEHGASADPYLFDPGTEARFLEHGYEQQGAIVEEYVCCRLLDPEAPRTARLRAMISEALPVTRLDAALDRPVVRLPWPGAETRGICR